MPKISEFYGIAIYIYYRDHGPAHFHAIYSGDEVLVDIGSLAVIEGRIPPRAMGMVAEWASIHQSELKRVWEQARKHEPLAKIEPLP